ncbi:MAG: hypothetical protein KGK17_01925, partial [Betaproteobacteria bacterium]|nr:hypothetical protein [Betaproteobacteria bacterium]
MDRLAKAKAERLKTPAPVAEHLEQLREQVAPKTKDPLIDALKSLGYKAVDANQLAKEHSTGTMEERIKQVFMAEGRKLAPATPPSAPTAKPSQATPTVVEPAAPTAVDTRMQAIQHEAEGATGLPTGKQYGSVETEMGPQSVAIGAAKSFREQFADLYPEFRNLPDVGPKAIAEAIKKDKNNKLYTIIKDEVTQQIEREKVSPEAVAQRPSDFEAFSQAVDELAAQEKATVPPVAVQPKLFQTQATMPPEGLQAKAPQVEHGELLEGFKKPEPEAPKLPLGDMAPAGGAPRAVEDIQAAAERGVASPMVQPLVHTQALKQAVQAVTDFMTEQGLRVDPNGPRINVQLMEYIANGQVRPMRLLEWFERRGLDFDEIFSQAGMETASESGRLLQIWSRAAQVLGRSRGPAAKLLGEKAQRMTDTIRVQTGSPEAVKSTVERIVGPKRLSEVEEIIATLGKMDRTNRLGINRFLSDIANKPLSSKLFELYLNGLISSPVALQAKAVGDLIQKSFMLSERKLASTIDPAIAILSRRPRERFAGEASADLFGWASMFKEGFRRGMKAYTTEMLDENALDATRLPAIPGQLGRTI